MCTNDPAFSRSMVNGEAGAAEPVYGGGRLVEKIAYDVWFTDELIRRCRAHAARGYRLAATFVSPSKTEVVLVFEPFDWGGVRFPAAPDDGAGEPAN